jgi:hypothetical protein
VISSPASQIQRQAVCPIFEKAGVATNLDFIHFSSSHPNVNLRLVVSDQVHLVPQALSLHLFNYSQDQCHHSTFSRLYNTGFPVHKLKRTWRSTNKLLLDIYTTLNGNENIREFQGPFNPEVSNKPKAAKSRIYVVP